MPYRPDPIFDDGLEPDASVSVRGAITACIAALLSLCFAFFVTAWIMLRAVLNAPSTLLRRVLR